MQNEEVCLVFYLISPSFVSPSSTKRMVALSDLISMGIVTIMGLINYVVLT